MIKFVYFDVGGVALLDFSGTNNWIELMNEIGIKEEDREKFNDYWSSSEMSINTSLYVDDLKPEIEKIFHLKFKKGYSLLVDGFVNRFKRNAHIWPVINEIQKSVKVGLLTNMYPNMLSEINKAKLLPDIDWNIVVDTSIEKFQKPQREIFEIAENKCGYKGSEILFTDNTQKHLDGALKLGWKTFLYDPKDPEKSSKELLNYFRKNSGNIKE